MTPDEFTKHVGAESFAEAADVILRTKAHDEETIEQMFGTIKSQSLEIAGLRARLSRALRTIDELNQAYIDENI